MYIHIYVYVYYLLDRLVELVKRPLLNVKKGAYVKRPLMYEHAHERPLVYVKKATYVKRPLMYKHAHKRPLVYVKRALFSYVKRPLV